MIKRTIFLTAFCAALLFAAAPTHSNAQVTNQERIGYVNPQAILQKMPELKAVQQRLQNFIEKKQDELDQKQQDVNQQITQFQEDQADLSQEARQKEQARLGQLQADLQQAERQAQQEIQAKQQELVSPLYQEINNSISSVAEEMNLSYVLNTATSTGDVIILYASPEAQQKYDITDEVMADLGIGS